MIIKALLNFSTMALSVYVLGMSQQIWAGCVDSDGKSVLSSGIISLPIVKFRISTPTGNSNLTFITKEAFEAMSDSTLSEIVGDNPIKGQTDQNKADTLWNRVKRNTGNALKKSFRGLSDQYIQSYNKKWGPLKDEIAKIHDTFPKEGEDVSAAEVSWVEVLDKKYTLSNGKTLDSNSILKIHDSLELVERWKNLKDKPETDTQSNFDFEKGYKPSVHDLISSTYYTVADIGSLVFWSTLLFDGGAIFTTVKTISGGIFAFRLFYEIGGNMMSRNHLIEDDISSRTIKALKTIFYYSPRKYRFFFPWGQTTATFENRAKNIANNVAQTILVNSNRNIVVITEEADHIPLVIGELNKLVEFNLAVPK